MQRLIPAIIDAWRQAERDCDDVPAGSFRAYELGARVRVLRDAHAMATRPGAERDTVVQFLHEHGAGDVAQEGAAGAPDSRGGLSPAD